jgi:methylated-DNA-protein-cysteine methyltransferase related protein
VSTPFTDEVCRVIRSLRPGEVVSYGDVAHDAGRPGAARAVGAILATGTGDLPWWRVVRSNGSLPPVAPVEQAQRLAAEGVTLVGDRVTAAPSGRFRRP